MSFTNYCKVLFFIFCSLLSIHPLEAQEVRDNFSTGTIYDVEKDPLGRIWLASDDGVFVSDGLNYIQIPTGNHTITNSSIREMILKNDQLYLIYHNQGLVQLDLNTLVYKKITDQIVAGIIIIDKAHFFLLYANGSLNKVELGKNSVPVFHKIAQIGKYQDNLPMMVDYDQNNLIVAKPNYGIFKINKLNGRIEKKFNIVPNGFDNMFASLKERLFFINNNELFELDKNELFIKSKYVSEGKNLSFVLPISESEKVVIRSKKKIFLEKANQAQPIEFKLLKTKNYEIKNALFINNNNILFGSNQGLIKVFNMPQKISTIYDSSVQLDEYVNIRRKIIPISNNKIALFGFPKSHIYDLSTKKYTVISDQINSLYDAVIIKDKFIATSDGGGVKMGTIGSKKTQNIITKDIDTVTFYKSICDISAYKEGFVLLGRKGALVLYDYVHGISKVIKLKNDLIINEIKIDPNSGLIFIATSNGLYYYDLKKEIIVKKTKLVDANIADFDIISVGEKTLLWYISDKGLTGINLKNNLVEKNLSMANFDNAILTALKVDRFNRIWISTYNGIFAYEYPVNNVIKLENRNGLLNQEFNFKSAAVLFNGDLIFGGLNGYDIISPNLFKYDSKPIKGTILGYSIYGLNSRVYQHFNPQNVVHYNTANYYLELYFSMQNFDKFKLTEFEYQIDDMGWLPTQGLSYLYMYNLKDGLHTIKIRGWDDSGNPVLFDTIKVMQETDFIKSTNFRYFLFFIVIVLLLIVGFVYYYNIQELNRVKVNIAMDLHDEIGSILNRTLFTIKDDPILNKQSQLISYISEALFGIRTYINAFNTERMSVLQLLDEIKEHANNYFKHTGIEYQITYEIDKESDISTYLYRDLKLIIYEINQNVLKHSNATIVKNKIVISDGDLIAIIEDNGQLNNIESIERKGNGITNIRKRVSRLKGDVQFSINPNRSGLHIEIKLNLA